MRFLPVLAVSLVAGSLAVGPATGAFASVAKPAPRPSASAVSKQPLLSIAVDDGRTSVAAGDRITYRITIRNIGASTTRPLRVSQTVPAGLTLISADRNGAHHAGTVTWPVDLRRAQQATFTTVVQVGTMAPGVLRVASVACASSVAEKRPLVCATHSDLLVSTRTGAAPGRAVPHSVWYGLAGLIALAFLLTLGLLLRHRRRPTPVIEGQTLPDQQGSRDRQTGTIPSNRS